MKEEVSPQTELEFLADAILRLQASDLHLRCGRPPLFRVHGELIAAKSNALYEQDLIRILSSVCSEKNKQILQNLKQVDFSFEVEKKGRFRCNLFYEKGKLAAAIRMIPLQIPQASAIGIPQSFLDKLVSERGIVLITGATGMGKSTTLASSIQYMNENMRSHILCIEDPIEFIHHSKKSTITQREVGTDTLSFHDALKAGLRQDPDVIMLGEIRDQDTIQAALSASETGHLVLGTMHTNDASGTVERIVDMVSSTQKDQVRAQLSTNLLAICSQRLVETTQQNSRTLACELLFRTSTITDCIYRNQISELYKVIENSSQHYQMQTFDQHLERLVSSGVVAVSEALKHSTRPNELKLRLDGIQKDIA